MLHPSLPPLLLARAAERHGAVTSKDLRAAGLGPAAQHRRVAAGLLRPLFQGVSAVVSAETAFTAIAAIQLLYPNVSAERRTAAALWGFDGHPPGYVDLVCPPGARMRRAGLPAIRQAQIPAKAITTVAGLRCTTPTWTLGELGCAGVDADGVELALEFALRKRQTTESKLRLVLAERPSPQWSGSSVLAEALSRRRPGAPPTESYAETRFLQKVVRPLQLEDPERQWPISVPGRRVPFRADFLFRRRRDLDVEIDGEAGHARAEARDRDSVRDQLIRGEGLAVLRLSAWRVDRTPHGTQHVLRRELETVS